MKIYYLKDKKYGSERVPYKLVFENKTHYFVPDSYTNYEVFPKTGFSLRIEEVSVAEVQ
jgi:hypothetical protein